MESQLTCSRAGDSCGQKGLCTSSTWVPVTLIFQSGVSPISYSWYAHLMTELLWCTLYGAAQKLQVVRNASALTNKHFLIYPCVIATIQARLIVNWILSEIQQACLNMYSPAWSRAWICETVCFCPSDMCGFQICVGSIVILSKPSLLCPLSSERTSPLI